MANCATCQAEIAPGTRWCGICRTNTINPAIGRLASPGKRLGAYILDGLIPVFAIFFVLIAGAAAGDEADPDGGVAISLLLLFGYGVWALVLFARGTTPGKWVLGMCVVKEDGSRAGFLTMLMREWIGKLISGLIFSLGFLWILFDRDKQGWHDKLMSTYVIG